MRGRGEGGVEGSPRKRDGGEGRKNVQEETACPSPVQLFIGTRGCGEFLSEVLVLGLLSLLLSADR